MKTSAALAVLLLAACNAQGSPPQIAVEDAWARASVAGQSSTAVYLTIRNSGGDDRLVAVSSAAGNASIHSTTIEGGVMRMRPLQSLAVPAGSTVALKPGGTHVMLTGLARPLVAGSAVPLDLTFERSGRQRVEAAVRAASADGGAM